VPNIWTTICPNSTKRANPQINLDKFGVWAFLMFAKEDYLMTNKK
jgi:hypothetical protein